MRTSFIGDGRRRGTEGSLRWRHEGKGKARSNSNGSDDSAGDRTAKSLQQVVREKIANFEKRSITLTATEHKESIERNNSGVNWLKSLSMA